MDIESGDFGYSETKGNLVKIASVRVVSHFLFWFQVGNDCAKMKVLWRFGPLALFETSVISDQGKSTRAIRTLGWAGSIRRFSLKGT
jgi:hypothetical protein